MSSITAAGLGTADTPPCVPFELPANAMCEWEYGSVLGPECYFREWLLPGKILFQGLESQDQWAIWTTGVALLRTMCFHIGRHQVWWGVYTPQDFKYRDTYNCLDITAAAMFHLQRESLQWRKFYLTTTIYGEDPRSTVEHRCHVSNRRPAIKVKSPTTSFSDRKYGNRQWQGKWASVVIAYGGGSCKLMAAISQFGTRRWTLFVNKRILTDPLFTPKPDTEEE